MAEESNNLVAPNDGGNNRPSADERRKDLKQFRDTKGVTKKEDGAVILWIRKMFFSGKTMKEILLDIAENNVVPWLKDGAYNTVTSLAGQVIYRDHKSLPGPGTTTSTSGSFINYVSYADYANKNKQKEKATAAETSKKQDEADIQAGFEHPAFENDPPGTKDGKTSLQKAREFLDEMHRYVRKYHSLSVEDLGWMRGKTVNYAWDKYGWTEEEILAIREPTHISGNPKTPYIILMPKAHTDYDKT